MNFDEMMDKLSSLQSYAKENFVPIIRPVSAKFLFDFVKENKVKKVLEIGTAIGYSGSIMIASGIDYLKTIDINEKHLEIAKNTFESCGFGSQVDIICDDAKNVLPRLVENKEKYDMIFLDGAKGQYINYLPSLKELLVDNGIIFADNVLLQGMVESEEKIPHRKRTMVVNLRRYLNRVQEQDFETEIVRIEDGIAISRYVGGK